MSPDFSVAAGHWEAIAIYGSSQAQCHSTSVDSQPQKNWSKEKLPAFIQRKCFLFIKVNIFLHLIWNKASSFNQRKFPSPNILISDQVFNQRKSVLSFFVQNLHIKHFKEKWSIVKGMELERWCNPFFKNGFTMVKIKIVIDQDDHDVLISSRCLCFFSDK